MKHQSDADKKPLKKSFTQREETPKQQKLVRCTCNIMLQNLNSDSGIHKIFVCFPSVSNFFSETK